MPSLLVDITPEELGNPQKICFQRVIDAVKTVPPRAMTVSNSSDERDASTRSAALPSSSSPSLRYEKSFPSSWMSSAIALLLSSRCSHPPARTMPWGADSKIGHGRSHDERSTRSTGNPLSSTKLKSVSISPDSTARSISLVIRKLRQVSNVEPKPQIFRPPDGRS